MRAGLPTPRVQGMDTDRSYLDECLLRRRLRALGALAVAGLMAAAALWVLADAESYEPGLIAVVSIGPG
jgi:hypothetical protein